MPWLLVIHSIASAEYQKTPGTRFDVGELTSEFKRAVPALEGCDDTNGLLTCRRLTDDFTDSEKAAMDAAVVAHDPDSLAKRRAKEQSEEQEIPLGDFGAGAAGALAVLAGQGLVVRVRKKKTLPV